MNLSVQLGDIILDNPIIPASGTFGYGYEFAQFYDINQLGTFATKGITYEKRLGNPLPRIAELRSGLLNSIGLQNPGVEAVIQEEFVKLREVYHKQVIANVGGSTIEDYVKTVRLLCEQEIVSMIELNVSCPNVSHGGIQFGIDEQALEDLLTEVRKICAKPLFVKLSPNVTDIVKMAQIVERCGCDGVVLINTLVGMRINIKEKKPIIANKIAGLSGPAIFPVALRCVYQVYQAINIPIIGVGGIECAEDVIEMIMCGASAVQIGSANLIDPYACEKILHDLPQKMSELGYQTVSEMKGVAHR